MTIPRNWPRTTPYLWALWLLFVLERIYEACMIDLPGAEQGVKGSYIATGILYDLFLALVILGIFAFIQGIVLLTLKKRILWLFHLLAIMALLANFTLIEYFFVTKIPLDESLFFFSWDELQLIIGVGNRLSAGTILLLVGLVGVYMLTGWLLKRLRSREITNVLFHAAGMLTLCFSVFLVYRNAEKPLAESLINNKLSFFAAESAGYFFSPDRSSGTEARREDFAELDPQFVSSGDVNATFPLLNRLPETSGLSHYFNKKGTQPPNIVIIVVESLSSDLVGRNAWKTGHLMPFLDSLSARSLYFPNTLSTCDRTYNALPAVLTSVPNAPNGKMLQTMDFPNQWSLPGLLKKHYYSRFYCGVDLSFCNMLGFMNHIGTDYAVSRWDRPPVSEIDGVSNAWGYPDEYLYEQAFNDLKTVSAQGKSRLDIFLTISSHDPFVYPRADHYEAFVKQRLKSLPEHSHTRRRYEENARKIGAFSYTDDALKAFFDRAKKQPGYTNTIFVITGDHGTEFCMFDELSRFKVPVLIWSPLLKKGKTFNGVSTHLDIAPSLLNFLRLNYVDELPAIVPFIGREMDLRDGFHTDRTLAFSVSNCMNDYAFSNGYALLLGGLYKVDGDLVAKPAADKKRASWFRKQLEYYNQFSRYILEQEHVVRGEAGSHYMDERLFAFWQSFDRQQTKAEETQEGWFWADEIAIPLTVKALRLDITAEVFCQTENELKTFPNVIFALENPLEKEPLVAYYPLRPGYGRVLKNHWVRIRYSMTVESAVLSRLKPVNKIKCFLYNAQRKPYKVRNVKTTFRVSE